MNDGGPAFPIENNDLPGSYEAHPGMTLRDYFAAAALQGILSSETIVSATAKAARQENATLRATFVEVAYAYADAMIRKRVEER